MYFHLQSQFSDVLFGFLSFFFQNTGIKLIIVKIIIRISSVSISDFKLVSVLVNPIEMPDINIII